jgi:hypothetical protein
VGTAGFSKKSSGKGAGDSCAFYFKVLLDAIMLLLKPSRGSVGNGKVGNATIVPTGPNVDRDGEGERIHRPRQLAAKTSDDDAAWLSAMGKIVGGGRRKKLILMK